MFQFLIGRLKINPYFLIPHSLKSSFQFLIGRLKIQIVQTPARKKEEVSIPHR